MPPLIATLFNGTWSLIQRVFKAALDYPMQTAIIVLLCLSGWLYLGKQDALDTVAKRNDTIAEMEQASKDALAAQIAVNKQVTEKQTQIARKADANESDIIARGARYANSLPAKDYCREASATTETGIAQSSDSQSDTTVAIERADYDILIANTARLVQVKAWADDLIEQGLAVAVEGRQASNAKP